MVGFEEGYTYFEKNASAYAAATMSDSYVASVNDEINKLVQDLNSLEGFKTASNVLKGDVAEFWHTGTFNIDSALKGSSNRAFVDRSHDFASTDISTNFGDKYGLKYYSDGQASAKAQAVSVFQRFKEYQSHGGTDNLEDFLRSRGYDNAESVLNDPIYSGQIRIIPRDQLEEATQYLERMIKTEAARRPEQVYRYQETLDLLKDRLSDDKGAESIPLSKRKQKHLQRWRNRKNKCRRIGTYDRRTNQIRLYYSTGVQSRAYGSYHFYCLESCSGNNQGNRLFDEKRRNQR